MSVVFRTPWRFVNLKLPKKLPPPHEPIPVVGLPVAGYLEQAVASPLTSGLTALGKFKPKFPFKSLNSSACEFLALYLKCK